MTDEEAVKVYPTMVETADDGWVRDPGVLAVADAFGAFRPGDKVIVANDKKLFRVDHEDYGGGRKKVLRPSACGLTFPRGEWEGRRVYEIRSHTREWGTWVISAENIKAWKPQRMKKAG